MVGAAAAVPAISGFGADSTRGAEEMTTAEQHQQTRTGRMQAHTVRGGGGLQLHVREWGQR